MALVEVVLALFVFSVGAGLFLSTLVASKRASDGAERLHEALTLAKLRLLEAHAAWPQPTPSTTCTVDAETPRMALVTCETSLEIGSGKRRLSRSDIHGRPHLNPP